MVKIHCLHPVSDSIGAVIFLHGITGEYHDTWKAPKSEYDPFWPHWLKKDFSDLSIFAFNYQSSITKWNKFKTPGLIELARHAYADLKRQQALYGKPILFICHSMGGLIVKFMLRTAETAPNEGLALTKQTEGVVFIAVPHTGAQKASWAARLSAPVRPSDATKKSTMLRPVPANAASGVLVACRAIMRSAA